MDPLGRDRTPAHGELRPGRRLRGRSLVGAQVAVLAWVGLCLGCALAASALSETCASVAAGSRCTRVLRLEWYGLVTVEAVTFTATLVLSSANRARRRRIRALVIGAVVAPLALIAFVLLPVPGG